MKPPRVDVQVKSFFQIITIPSHINNNYWNYFSRAKMAMEIDRQWTDRRCDAGS
jgi:hypothetical protein